MNHRLLRPLMMMTNQPLDYSRRNKATCRTKRAVQCKRSTRTPTLIRLLRISSRAKSEKKPKKKQSKNEMNQSQKYQNCDWIL